MTYAETLVDTATLSEVIKGKDERVAQRARDYLDHHLSFTFSILTRYENLRGLMAKEARRQIQRFEEQCQRSRVLPLTDEIVVRAAEIYGDLHRRGGIIGDADTLIAATALVHGLPVTTENVDHFLRVQGLRVESWRAPR